MGILGGGKVLLNDVPAYGGGLAQVDADPLPRPHPRRNNDAVLRSHAVTGTNALLHSPAGLATIWT